MHSLFAIPGCGILLGASIFDQRLSQLFLTTGKLAALTILIALPVATLLAWLLSRCAVFGRQLCEACLLVLLFMPLHTQVTAWEAGFGRGGWYSTLFAGKLSDPPLSGLAGATWVHAVAAIPWMYWLIKLALRAIPAAYEAAAKLDGSAWQVFGRVTLPLALPGVVAAALFAAMTVATEITVTDVYQVRTYAEELYNGFVLGVELSELPLRVGPVMLLLWSLVVCGIGVCYLVWPAATGAISARHTVRRDVNWLATGVVVAILALLLLVPLGNLIYQAGIEVRELQGVRQRAWSSRKVLEVLVRSPFEFRSELAWTAVLAQVSAISAVAAAGFMVWWSQQGRIQLWLAAGLAIFVYALPGPLIGLGIIQLLNSSRAPDIFGWLYGDTLFAPTVALGLRAFPLAYVVLWYGWQSMPTRMLESARVDGAGRWDIWRYVVWPWMLPSVLCAGLVSMAVAAADLSASVLVLPAGVTTVSRRIFELVHYGAEESLAGLCLVNMLIMSLLALLFQLVLHFLGSLQQAKP